MDISNFNSEEGGGGRGGGGTNCADLFLFCYERNFMKSLSRENQADIIEAFNSTSRYLDDLLNILTIFTLTKWWTGYTLQNSN